MTNTVPLPEPQHHNFEDWPALLAAVQEDRDRWIRRADKTWHEKKFTDEIAELTARVKVLEDALHMVGLLRRLGGILPSANQVVQIVVEAARVALEKPQ